MATRSTRAKEEASKPMKRATTDKEGRKFTKCIDRALHGCVGDIGTTAEATAADCTALPPLALKLAAVYRPCAPQANKTPERMEGLGNAYGLRSRRKENILHVDWLLRVLYRLEYCDHTLLTYCGVVALLEKHRQFDVGWGYSSMDGQLRAEAAPRRRVSQGAARHARSSQGL